MLKNISIVSPFRESDVAGIDINMGCPKEYSTKASGLDVRPQSSIFVSYVPAE